jgi:hypothetical protein
MDKFVYAVLVPNGAWQMNVLAGARTTRHRAHCPEWRRRPSSSSKPHWILLLANS